MELQEFITETLTQIVNGVVDAQKNLKDTGCIINPYGYAFDKEHKFTEIKGGQYKARAIQRVKMNIVLSVMESKDKASKIGVANILHAGFGTDKSKENSQMNSIEFEIPIALPVMENINE